MNVLLHVRSKHSSKQTHVYIGCSELFAHCMVCALVIDVNASGRKVRMFVCAFSVAQWANMDTLGADTSRTLYAAGKQELLDDPVGGGRFVMIRVCLTLSYIWMVPCFYCYVH